MRHVPVETLVGAFPDAAIPGVVDGEVLREPIGAALAAGRFAHVPVLNGVNHNEEWIFVAGLQLAVSGGRFVPAPVPTADTYASAIASVLGVSAARASAIAAEYPLSAYPAPILALSVLVSDANFACPALQVDRWTARRVRTFAYEFDDDTAPQSSPDRLCPRSRPIRRRSSTSSTSRTRPSPLSLNPVAGGPGREHASGVGELRRAW